MRMLADRDLGFQGQGCPVQHQDFVLALVAHIDLAGHRMHHYRGQKGVL